MGNFIGRRIIPRHDGLWDAQKEYEELVVVLEEGTGDSYISRRPVPAGTSLGNTLFWSLCSRFSEQMEMLEKRVAEDVDTMHKDVSEAKEAMTKELSDSKEALAQQLDKGLSAMMGQTTEAINRSEQNRSIVEERMDVIVQRVEANVTASTEANSDYAAEVVDSRVGHDGKVFSSLGEAMRTNGAQTDYLSGFFSRQKNILNMDDIQKYAYVSSSGGLVDTGDLAMTYAATGWIEVEPGASYACSENGRATEFGSYACFDADKNCISGGRGLPALWVAPENAYYLRFSIPLSRMESELQVEKGTEVTAFEKFQFAVIKEAVPNTVMNDIAQNRMASVSNAERIGQLENDQNEMKPFFNRLGIEAGRFYNLFDFQNVTGSSRIGEDGQILADSTYCTSEMIEVHAGTYYGFFYDATAKKCTNQYIGFYDKEGVFLPPRQLGIQGVTAPENAMFMRVAPSIANAPMFMVIEGEANPVKYYPYMDGDFKYVLEDRIQIPRLESIQTQVDELRSQITVPVTLSMSSYSETHGGGFFYLEKGIPTETIYKCDILYAEISGRGILRFVKSKVYKYWKCLYGFYADEELQECLGYVNHDFSEAGCSYEELILSIPTGTRFLATTYLYNADLETAAEVTGYDGINETVHDNADKLSDLTAEFKRLVKPLKGKCVAVCGDSIMMLQRSHGIKTDDMIDQEKLDNQDWDTLKDMLECRDVINLGLGGATVSDNVGEETSYPLPDDTEGRTSYLTNEIRWLQRLVAEGKRPEPDVVMIWCGTNDGTKIDENYEEVMELSYDELVDSDHKSIRKTFYGGLRTSVEMIKRRFPKASVFLFSPIQRNYNPVNPENRTYEVQEIKSDAIRKVAGRYSCVFADALREIGIVDFYENCNKDGTTRFLGDGLHPNADGKKVLTHYTVAVLRNKYAALN